jgi:hypothetical protein
MSRLCCISLCVALALPGCRAEVPTEPASAPEIPVAQNPSAPMRWLDAAQARRIGALVQTLATSTPAACRDLGLVDHVAGQSPDPPRLSCATGTAPDAVPDVQVQVEAPTSKSVAASIRLPRGSCASAAGLGPESSGDGWQVLPGPTQSPDGGTDQWMASYHHAGLRAWVIASGPMHDGRHCQTRIAVRRELGPVGHER